MACRPGSHGVTEFTSDLVYQGESGALNESFLDMMGNSSEFYAAERPDWWIGEDVYVATDVAPGFRNMADPAEDPDHYGERYTGKKDNGGVHINSGIPNHAYYLLLNGGENARDNTSGHNHDGPNVLGIGLGPAEQIFFTGFTSLAPTATISQARAATVTAATDEYGAGSQQVISTRRARTVVGVR